MPMSQRPAPALRLRCCPTCSLSSFIFEHGRVLLPHHTITSPWLVARQADLGERMVADWVFVTTKSQRHCDGTASQRSSVGADVSGGLPPRICAAQIFRVAHCTTSSSPRARVVLPEGGGAGQVGPRFIDRSSPKRLGHGGSEAARLALQNGRPPSGARTWKLWTMRGSSAARARARPAPR